MGLSIKFFIKSVCTVHLPKLLGTEELMNLLNRIEGFLASGNEAGGWERREWRMEDGGWRRKGTNEASPFAEGYGGTGSLDPCLNNQATREQSINHR
jgi:hypothetical protein